MIDGQGGIEIPGQLLVQLVLPGNRVHVGRVGGRERIVIMLAARIPRRLPGMRPTHAYFILQPEFLAQSHPRAVALALVLKFQVRRNAAVQMLPDTVDAQPEWERVLRSDLEGRLVGDISQVRRRGYAGVAREL